MSRRNDTSIGLKRSTVHTRATCAHLLAALMRNSNRLPLDPSPALSPSYPGGAPLSITDLAICVLDPKTDEVLARVKLCMLIPMETRLTIPDPEHLGFWHVTLLPLRRWAEQKYGMRGEVNDRWFWLAATAEQLTCDADLQTAVGEVVLESVKLEALSVYWCSEDTINEVCAWTGHEDDQTDEEEVTGADEDEIEDETEDEAKDETEDESENEL